MKLSYVSLAFLLVVFVGLEGCTKKGGDKKKDTGGEEPVDDTGTDDTGGGDPACLALQEDAGEETDADGDADAGTDDTEVTDEETDGAEGDDDGEDPLADPETEVTTTNDSGCPPVTPTDGGGGGGSGGWDEGPGLAKCNEDDKAWKAVVNGGPAQCGGALVDWCCTRTEGLKRFPTLAHLLGPAFDKTEAGDPALELTFKLYNCSLDEGVTFHFAGVDKNKKVHYKTVTTAGKAAAAGDPKDDSCVAVTATDLGLDALLGGGDDEGEDDEGGDDEGGDDEGGTDGIPSTIGELTNADDKEKIRDWLVSASLGAGVWSRTTKEAGAHHGATNVTQFRTSYNETIREGFDDADEDKKLPVGSLAVKQLYNAANETLGYVIMGKAKDVDGKDGWLFFEVKGDNEDDWKAADPGVHGLGVAACVACHTGDTDREFIKGTVPAP